MSKKEPLEAILYLVDGTTEIVSPKNGCYFTLKELQEIVGGYIECFYIADNEVLTFNEEGKLQDLQVNQKATEVFSRYNPYDALVGPVLRCHTKMIR